MSGASTSVGMDLVEVARFSNSASMPGFLERICTERELEQARAEPREAAACRFAYKEAVLKALGTGAWQRGTTFSDVEVIFEGGFPGPATVSLGGAAARLLGDREIVTWHHVTRDLAKAWCVLVPRDPDQW